MSKTGGCGMYFSGKQLIRPSKKDIIYGIYFNQKELNFYLHIYLLHTR